MSELHKQFWSKVKTGPLGTCWPWTAARISAGYGHFRLGDKFPYSHRFAWELAWLEPVHKGMQVLHHCDNPPCCNPSHLFLGTSADNMADRDAKGRNAKGDKLSEENVREIRRLVSGGESQRSMADAFSVSYEQIRNIVRRRHWKHIS